jgi:hypothetical protein
LSLVPPGSIPEMISERSALRTEADLESTGQMIFGGAGDCACLLGKIVYKIWMFPQKNAKAGRINPLETTCRIQK